MLKKHKDYLYAVSVIIITNALTSLPIVLLYYLQVLSQYQTRVALLISVPISLALACFFSAKKFKITIKLKRIKSTASIIYYALALTLFVFILQITLDMPFINVMLDGKLRFFKFNDRFMSDSYAIVYFVKSVLIGPVLEEILFRRILFRKLIDIYKIPTSIVLTSLIFALMHLSLEGFLAYFVIGVFFTYLYFITKDLTLIIVAHMFMNLCANLTLIEEYEPYESMYFLGIFIYVVSTLGIFFGIKKVKNLIKNF